MLGYGRQVNPAIAVRRLSTVRGSEHSETETIGPGVHQSRMPGPG
jgi:hypothetical protein